MVRCQSYAHTFGRKDPALVRPLGEPTSIAQVLKLAVHLDRQSAPGPLGSEAGAVEITSSSGFGIDLRTAGRRLQLLRSAQDCKS